MMMKMREWLVGKKFTPAAVAAVSLA